jgi:serine protease Do
MRTSIRLGESVASFGYPLANVLSSSGNFALGNITALAGLGDDSRYLQIGSYTTRQLGRATFRSERKCYWHCHCKIGCLKMMVATQGDIAQNVNFAIKGTVAANFLETNRIKFDVGRAKHHKLTAIAPFAAFAVES